MHGNKISIESVCIEEGQMRAALENKENTRFLHLVDDDCNGLSGSS